MKKNTIKIIVIVIIIITICYLVLNKIFKNNTMAYSAGQTCAVCFNGTLAYKTYNCKYGLWCSYCASFYGGTTESHSYGSWTTYQSATCTSAAKTKRTCSSCGKVEYGTGQSATGHMLSQWSTIKQPTCTEKGKRTRDCSICFQEFSEDIPATGHNESTTWTTIQYPSCVQEGKEVLKCLNCGATTQERTLEKYSHILSLWSTIKQPTCTEKGKRTRDCSICFQEFSEDIPEIGHDLSDDDWEVSVEGNCQTKATLIRYCRRTDICDYSETRDGEFGECDFGDWQIYVYGDCTTPRILRRYCRNGLCSKYEQDETGKLIHPYTKEEIIKEPTCLEDGEKRITCYSCNAVEIEVIKSNGSHNMQLMPDKNLPGEHYTACSVCGERDTDSFWNDPCQLKVVNVTPTPKYCTDIVTIEYKCECGYSYNEKEQFLPEHLTNHDGGINLIKEATCIEPGYRTFYCGRELDEGVRCMYEYDAQEIPINLDAHNEKWVPVKGESIDQCVCTLCKEVLMTQNCIPKAEKTKHYPTCISDGYEIYHCQICDRTIGEPDFSTNMGRALGHDYQDGITCSRCSHQIEEVESLKYEIDDTYISNINSQTSIEDFMGQIITGANEIKIYKADNTIEIDEKEKIATGMKIASKSGERTSTLTIVVTGDTNGDGDANFSDMIILNKARLGKTILENEFFKAADVNNDEKNDILDLVRLNKFRLNQIKEL